MHGKTHLTPGDRASIAWFVGRMHVGASNRAVIAMLARRVARGWRKRLKIKRSLRHEAYRHAIAVHARNLKLYTAVVNGTL